MCPGFVGHGLDRTRKTGQILSSNGEGGTRARSCWRRCRTAPSATGPELARAARRRRPHAAPRRRRPARPRHPRRGRARPRRQLPAQARLPRPAADVHQRRGRRGRARACWPPGASAWRPRARWARSGASLPDRVRLRRRVARADRSASPATVEAAPPDGETLLALADAARRGRRVAATLHATPPASRRARELSPYGVVAHSGRWYVAGLRPPPRRAARPARRPRRARRRSAGRASRAPDGFDAVGVRQPHARARALGARGRGRPAHRPRPAPPAASRPRSPSSSPPRRHAAARCAPTRWTGPPSLLAGAGCASPSSRPHGRSRPRLRSARRAARETLKRAAL